VRWWLGLITHCFPSFPSFSIFSPGGGRRPIASPVELLVWSVLRLFDRWLELELELDNNNKHSYLPYVTSRECRATYSTVLSVIYCYLVGMISRDTYCWHDSQAQQTVQQPELSQRTLTNTHAHTHTHTSTSPASQPAPQPPSPRSSSYLLRELHLSGSLSFKMLHY